MSEKKKPSSNKKSKSAGKKTATQKKKVYPFWKNKKTDPKKYNKTIVLSEEDIILTYSHLSNLRVSERRRDWIENTMYRLRQEANRYERICIDLLQKYGMKFIHKAPFVFEDKIYFADFYFPSERTILELDGASHDSDDKVKYDKERDYAFKSYMIKVIRIRLNGNSQENKRSVQYDCIEKNIQTITNNNHYQV